MPVAGGAGVELFTWLVAPPLERRKNAWMEDVAHGLRELEEKAQLNLDALQSDEAFLDVILHATQAALRTSQAEKREALRNAVLNSARPNAPELVEQQMFVSVVDEFTEWHLRLLGLFQNPAAHVGNTYMGGLSGVVEQAFPALRGRRDFYDQVWRELYSRGLVTTEGLHTMMSASGLAAKRTTDRGDRLLAFITAPV